MTTRGRPRYCRADDYVWCDTHGEIHERPEREPDPSVCLSCGSRSLTPDMGSTYYVCDACGDEWNGYDLYEDGTGCWTTDWRPVAILTTDRQEFRR